VRASRIHGTGVFASRDFGRGDVILAIDDSDPVPDRSRLTPEQSIHIDVFICRDGKDRVAFMKSPERYINTSCDPNVYSRTDMKSGIRYAYALKDIRRGEEVTWDYAINSSEEWETPVECNCGSSNCRKIIRGDFFTLPREVQLKYIPLLNHPFKERFKKEIVAIGPRK
jgi:hypothetical protein